MNSAGRCWHGIRNSGRHSAFRWCALLLAGRASRRRKPFNRLLPANNRGKPTYMSVRAHRVITKKVADEASFNLWNDEGFVNELGDNLTNQLDDDGGGMISLEVVRIEEALAAKDVDIDPETRKILLADIAAAKEAKEDYIEYDCF